MFQQRAKAAQQFLEEESGQYSSFHCSSTKELKSSQHEAPKWWIKQGPVKSSKKQKGITKDEGRVKDDDELPTQSYSSNCL